MTDYSLFPALNATLNGASAILITTGRALIARKLVKLHRTCMIAAFATSSVFLVSYLYYHAHVGSVHFPGQGVGEAGLFHDPDFTYGAGCGGGATGGLVADLWIEVAFDRHRRISRWTFPVWLYVSVTGVVVYVMLYQIYGGHA